jgi:hypothetical protein
LNQIGAIARQSAIENVIETFHTGFARAVVPSFWFFDHDYFQWID